MRRTGLLGTSILSAGMCVAEAARSAVMLRAPAFAYQNTAFTNDLSDDGYSWTNALPITVDQYGCILTIAQRHNNSSKQHTIVYSNDGGATWSDSSIASAFLERGTAAYDSANDLLHVLWQAAAVTDGIIYRRYSITRDGSNNITGISQVAGINLQLDYENAGTMSYQHPLLLWLDDAGFGANGALLAVWSARNSAGTPNTNEIRASMRVLSNTVDDNTAANWSAPIAASTSSIGQSPQVAYSALVVNSAGGIAYPSIGRKASGTHARDLYLCYHTGAAAGQWRWRRAQWNAGTNNWSTGLTTDILLSNEVRAGTDTGYALKEQLGSAVHEDAASDRMLFGLATWASDVLGDTWGYVGINADDSLTSLIDVYSAGGAHSFAPVGDLCVDATSQRIVVSWLTTTTEYARVQLYDGLASAGDPVTAYDAVSPNGVDIPLLYPRRQGKLLMMFRDRVNQTPPSGSPRYRGVFGTLTWG